MRENTYKILKELFDGGLNKKTQKAIRRWFFQGTDRAHKDEALRKMWEEQIRYETAADPELHRRFALLCQRLGIPVPAATSQKTYIQCTSRRFLSRVAAVAAVLVIGIVGFAVYRYADFSRTLRMVERIEKSYAGQPPRMIQLPCGSEVWLRGESQLNIAMDSQRELSLKGEAHFSVKPNGKPFVVHTEHIDIKVLGTVFCVKDKEDLDVLTVDLFDGSIELTVGSETFPLEEGKRFTMDRSTGKWDIEPMRRNFGHPDWMRTAALPSDGITFDDILGIISKVYNIEVINNRPDLGPGKYFFTPTEDMDIPEAMNTLRLLNHGFAYRMEDNKLIID